MDAIVTKSRRRIIWLHVLTVVSAAILIAAEVFGAAFAGGWALENLTGLGSLLLGIAHWIVSLFGVEFDVTATAGARLLQALLFVLGAYVMFRFIRAARRVEPFTTNE
ncbi:MAG TPA: hypothetical protein VNL39_10535 [Xanthobacteraceae bacterium]|nr:hypothetical protein [Xanthobacteraceae bacterium]